MFDAGTAFMYHLKKVILYRKRYPNH